MGTNSTHCTEWERDFDPKTEQPIIVGHGCSRPCDFSGYVNIVEPTTGRITGRLPMCKTCGSIPATLAASRGGHG